MNIKDVTPGLATGGTKIPMVGGRTNFSHTDNTPDKLPENQGYPFADLDSFQKVLLTAYGLNAGNVKSWTPYAMSVGSTNNVPVSTNNNNYFYNNTVQSGTVPNPSPIYWGFYNIALNYTATVVNATYKFGKVRQTVPNGFGNYITFDQGGPLPVVTAPQTVNSISYNSTRPESFLAVFAQIQTDGTGTVTGNLYFAFEGIQIFTT